MRQYTVADRNGREVIFDWDGTQDPSDAELQNIFDESEKFAPAAPTIPIIPPVPTQSELEALPNKEPWRIPTAGPVPPPVKLPDLSRAIRMPADVMANPPNQPELPAPAAPAYVPLAEAAPARVLGLTMKPAGVPEETIPPTRPPQENLIKNEREIPGLLATAFVKRVAQGYAGLGKSFGELQANLMEDFGDIADYAIGSPDIFKDVSKRKGVLYQAAKSAYETAQKIREKGEDVTQYWNPSPKEQQALGKMGVAGNVLMGAADMAYFIPTLVATGGEQQAAALVRQFAQKNGIDALVKAAPVIYRQSPQFTERLLSNAISMGEVGAMEGYSEGDLKEALKKGLINAGMGVTGAVGGKLATAYTYRMSPLLQRTAQAGIQGGVFGGFTAAQGGKPDDILSSIVLGIGFGLSEKPYGSTEALYQNAYQNLAGKANLSPAEWETLRPKETEGFVKFGNRFGNTILYRRSRQIFEPLVETDWKALEPRKGELYADYQERLNTALNDAISAKKGGGPSPAPAPTTPPVIPPALPPVAAAAERPIPEAAPVLTEKLITAKKPESTGPVAPSLPKMKTLDYFAIKTPEEFLALPEATRNEIFPQLTKYEQDKINQTTAPAAIAPAAAAAPAPALEGKPIEPAVPVIPRLPVPKPGIVYPQMGSSELADFGIRNKEDFWKLPEDKQHEIWQQLNPAAQDDLIPTPEEAPAVPPAAPEAPIAAVKLIEPSIPMLKKPDETAKGVWNQVVHWDVPKAPLEILDRAARQDKMLQKLEPQARKEQITKTMDSVLGDYGVVNMNDLEIAIKQLDENKIPYSLEISDIGNLGGLNDIRGSHEVANVDLKKVLGEIYANGARAYGAIVGRSKGDEFTTVWPNYTPEQVDFIRKDLNRQIDIKRRELGLENTEHPKYGKMPTGALYLDYGVVKAEPGKYRENSILADKLQVLSKQQRIIETATAKGYIYNTGAQRYEYGKPQGTVGIPAELAGQGAPNKTISGQERGGQIPSAEVTRETPRNINQEIVPEEIKPETPAPAAPPAAEIIPSEKVVHPAAPAPARVSRRLTEKEKQYIDKAIADGFTNVTTLVRGNKRWVRIYKDDQTERIIPEKSPAAEYARTKIEALKIEKAVTPEIPKPVTPAPAEPLPEKVPSVSATEKPAAEMITTTKPEEKVPATIDPMKLSYEDALKYALTIPTTDKIDTPERKAKHAEIVDKLYGTGSKNKNKEATIIIGLPASGKSTIANKIVDENGSLILDSDLISMELPEYNQGIGANAVHLESVHILNGRMFPKTLAAGDNIIHPCLGRKLNVLKVEIEQLKKQGYTVKLINVKLDPKIANQRLIDRWEKETGENKRLVPNDNLDEKYAQIASNYSILKEEGRADEYEERDGQTGEIISRTVSGEKLGGNLESPGGRGGEGIPRVLGQNEFPGRPAGVKKVTEEPSGRIYSENAPGTVERGTAQNGGRPAGEGGAHLETGTGRESSRPANKEAHPERPSAERGGRNGSGRSLASEDGGSGGARGDEPAVVTSDVKNPPKKLIDYLIDETDNIGHGGAVQKTNDNISAIKILKHIESENRFATPEEQQALVKYVGWGGLKNVFKENDRFFEDIKGLLTEEEYAAARRSVLNAHYTSPQIISQIWNGVLRLGFKGGNVLEPAIGIGHFFGLRPMHNKMSMDGIELDSISARIARQLYQNAEIRNQGYETLKMPKDYYNLIISNVPFSENSPVEPNDVKTPGVGTGHALHDFYFLKSIYGLKPGGVIAFVTSHYTMDKKDAAGFRKKITDQADFLGAIRLPQTAFKQNAGTEVCTDIIFLQKRKEGNKESDLNQLFVRAEPVKMAAPKVGGEKEVFVNKYFINRPEMIIGKPSLKGTMYAGDLYTVELNPDILPAQFQEMISRTMENLPENIMDAEIEVKTEKMNTEPFENIDDISRMPAGTFFVHKNAIYQVDENGKPQAIKGKNADRIGRMAHIKNTLQSMFDLQRSDKTAEAEKKLKQLNSEYDSFVKKYGAINTPENKRAFEEDSSYYMLCSLEKYNERENTAEKAAIFKGVTFHPEKIVEKTDSTNEALIISLNKFGSVNIHQIAKLLGVDGAGAVERLTSEGLIFRNAEDFLNGNKEVYQTRVEYLSGNVRTKLEQALKAAKKNPEFLVNVRELEAIIPADIPPEKISIKINSPILERQDVESFLKQLFEAYRVKCVHNNFDGSWNINIETHYYELINRTYGTDDMDGEDIVKELMKGRSPQVWRTSMVDGQEIRTFDEVATAAVKAKGELITKKFKDWIWTDDERTKRLVRSFNDRFNSFVPRDYTHPMRISNPNADVKFPGSAFPFPARNHQSDGVWRIIQSKNTMLAHEVGSGKTLTAIWSGMELKRLGLIKKPMYTFPNHLLRQWANDFYSAYPNANLLVAKEGDFAPEKRRLFINKIATGDWDAVLVRAEDFKRIPLSPREEAEQLRYVVAEFKDFINKLHEGNEDKRTIRKMEIKLQKFEDRLASLKNKAAKERGVLYFEDLGCDMIYVDEADSYKNLEYFTQLQGVKGMGTQAGSGRSFDLYMKTRYFARKGGKLVFMTGTPISNTLVEAYTMMKFLQLEWLHDEGIESFDDWSRLFADTVTELELDNTGSSYRPSTRFSKITNVPALMKALREVWDIKTADYLEEKKILIPGKDLPKNTVINISAPLTDEMKSFKRYMVAREDDLKHAGKPEKGADNVLVIISDGRKAAVDLRLFSPGLPDMPESKLNIAVKNIARIYKEYDKQKYTQIVFIDEPRSYRFDPVRTERILTFDASADIVKKLIAEGINPDEIVDITDKKYKTSTAKKRVFEDMRIGRVRILIGSTKKFGAGANMQDLGKAIHHIDAKWRPRDFTQGNGRFVRQGNLVADFDKNGKRITPEGEIGHVEIYNYVTKGSIDTGLWNMLEVKAKSIKKIMNQQENPEFEVEEDYFTSVKDLSIEDPLIKEAVGLRQKVRDLKNLETAHRFEISKLKADHKIFPERKKRLEDGIKKYEEDIARRGPEPKGEEFSMKIGDNTFTKRTEAGDELMKIINPILKQYKESNGKAQKKEKIGEYASFPLAIEITTGFDNSGVIPKVEIIARGKWNYIGSFDMETRSPLGLISSLNNSIYSKLDKFLERDQNELKYLVQKNEANSKRLDEEFPQAKELEQTQGRMAEVDKELSQRKPEVVNPEDEKYDWKALRQFIPVSDKPEEGEIRETEEGEVVPETEKPAPEKIQNEIQAKAIPAGTEIELAEKDRYYYYAGNGIFKFAPKAKPIKLVPTIEGIEYFIFKKKPKDISIHEVKSGLRIGSGETISEAVTNAEKQLSDSGVDKEKFDKLLTESLAGKNKAGLSPRYRVKGEESAAVQEPTAGYEVVTEKNSVKEIGYTPAEVKQTFGSMEAVNEAINSVKRTIENTTPKTPTFTERDIREISGWKPVAGRPYSRTIGRIPGVGKAGETIVQVDWRKNKRIDYTGMKITTPHEIAQLFSVYRHPHLEHMHIIYLDKKNRIVAHNMMSSGLSNAAQGTEFEDNFIRSANKMIDRMKRLGATKYFLVHNHPGGDPNPSNADVKITARYSKEVKGFAGHIIIDDTKFAVINKNSEINLNNYIPAKKYEIANIRISSHADVAKAVKGLMNDQTKAVQIVMNVKNGIHAWYPIRTDIPLNKQNIYQNQKNAGGTLSIIVVNENFADAAFKKSVKDAYVSQKNQREDIILDVVWEDSKHPESPRYWNEFNVFSSNKIGGFSGKQKEGFVWEPMAAYGEKVAPVFYSNAERAVKLIPMPKAPASQWLKMLAPESGRGTKADEMKWIGLDDYLKEQGNNSLTKQEILDFIDQNKVNLEEITKSSTKRDISIVEEIKNRGEAAELRKVEIAEKLGAKPYFSGRPLRWLYKDKNDNPIDVPKEYQEELDRLESDITSAMDLYDVESITDAEMNILQTRYHDWTLPRGNENYREVLITLPEYGEPGSLVKTAPNKPPSLALTEEKYQSPHYDEPNILAHFRLDDRTGPAGEKILFIEEIQSDWHQRGREKGYAGKELTKEDAQKEGYSVYREKSNLGTEAYFINGPENLRNIPLFGFDTEKEAWNEIISYIKRESEPKVPAAPFSKTWHELAFKRILRMAVDEGYDKIAWTTGEQQAERYESALLKEISSIQYHKSGEDRFIVNVYDKKENIVPGIPKDMRSNDLEQYFGKGIAQQIIAGEGAGPVDGIKELTGLNIKIGGEGMKGFYDKILVDYANKYGKKWGSKVEDLEIPGIGTPAGHRVANEQDIFEEDGRFFIKTFDGELGPFEDLHEAETEMRLYNKDISEREPGVVHSFEITEPMKKSVISEGQAMFEPPALYGTGTEEPILVREPGAPYAEGEIRMTDADQNALKPKENAVSRVTGAILQRIKNLYSAITKTPHYSNYKKVLLTWDGNMQRWAQVATTASDYVNKALKSPLKAEALTIWREAGGDEGIIRSWIAKTTDPKLRKGYEAALRLTDADKKIGEWVGSQYAELLKEAQTRGLVDYGLKNYVTHLVDLDGTKPDGFAGRLVAGFRFGKEREIPTLFDAEQAGYKIQTKNIGDLLAIYINELGKAIETKDFIKGLSEAKDEGDGRPLVTPMGLGETVPPKEAGKKNTYLIISGIKGKKFEDYKPINHYAMTDWKWVDKTDDGENILFKGNLAVHPKYFKHLRNVLGTDAIREWFRQELPPLQELPRTLLKGIDYLQSMTKQAMFSLSAFHWVQEGTHAIGHKVNPFMVKTIDLQNNPLHYDAAIHGLKLRGDYHGMQSFREGLSSGPILYRIPWAGPVLEQISEPLFTWYIPALKYKTYEHMLARNTKRYQKEIKEGKVTIDDVKFLSAQQANAAYGHLNYIEMGRSKTIQHLFQATLLAPDFLEARARFAAQGMKSILNPKSKAGREQLMALTTLAVVFFVAARILNKLNDDDYHWDEPFMVVIKNRRYGLRNVPEDMYRLFKNTHQFVNGRMSPLLGKTAQWFISKRDFRGQPQSPVDFIKEEILAPVPISFSRMLPGKIGNKDIEPWQSFITSMGLQVSRYSKATEVYDMVDAWKKKKGITEVKQSFPPSKYRDVRNALQDDNLEKANNEWNKLIQEEKKINPEDPLSIIRKKLGHGFRVGLQKPFTGSMAHEKEFKKSLNPEEKDAYDRAIKERKEIYKNFLKIYHGPLTNEEPAGTSPTEEEIETTTTEE